MEYKDERMKHRKFGNQWTEEKLQALRDYLNQYLLIFTRNPKARLFTRHYVDAFAGSGLRAVNAKDEILPFPDFEEARKYMDGSPKIALSLDDAFHRYWFIEKDLQSAQSLSDLINNDFPDRAPLCEVKCDDANSFFQWWCDTLRPNDRAVVFLDPFAMECHWETVERIGATKKIDLWVLFPVSAVIRTLPHAGPRDDWRPSLTRLFGTNEWESYFYQPSPTNDLFGDDRSDRDVTVDKVVRFYVQRLKTAFTEVTDQPLILYNSRGSAMFGLAFAAGNRQGAGPALRIASHLTRRMRR